MQHHCFRHTSAGVAIAIAALIATPAWSNSTQCTNAGLTRSIEVVYSDPGQPVPCEVIYDKSAEGAGQHSLWRAGSEAGYCEAQASAFVDKLRSLGWNCEGVAPAATEQAPAAAKQQPAASQEQPVEAEELLGESIDPAPASEG